MTRAPREQTKLEPGRPAALLGQRVSFTGRLATMSREQAERLVTLAAGRPAASVTARTTMLVVGMRGWPLMNSGQVPGKLAEAERLRAARKPIRILTETEFRETVGLQNPPDPGPKSLSGPQVCAALGIDARSLQRWEHCGLVRSHDGLYDFRDLVSLRKVTDLVARGVCPTVIRRSLDSLGAFMPGVDRPLAQLNILVSASGALVAELEEAFLTTSGQLEIRFGGPDRAGGEAPRVLGLAAPGTRDSAAWIDAGIEEEEAGDLEAAERAYRTAAALAPSDPAPQFNLGNVLHAAGRHADAAGCFARAVALDPAHARAWFNLAHVQEAMGDPRAALTSLRRAIAADPLYPDAHYNLAELCESLGDGAAAAAAWTAYIRLDPTSEWGGEARRRLQALRKAGAWA